MRIVRYREPGSVRLGRVEGDEIAPLHGSAACASTPIASGDFRDDAKAARPRLRDVALLPPVTAGRFFCVGVNFQEHAAELAREQRKWPAFFTRTAQSLTGSGQALWLPRASEQFDFEGELACVIGAPGRRIPVTQALDHVFGYACFQDGSVRDFQRHSPTAGKNFDRSGAMGPWIVTRDEAPPWDATRITTRLNGETVQQADTRHMMHSVPDLVAYVSTFTALLPGDVIVTGTPAGVGSRRTPPLWMKAGDRVEVEIDGVGVLANSVEREPALVTAGMIS